MLSRIRIHEGPDFLRIERHLAWVGAGPTAAAMPFDPDEERAARQALARFGQRRAQRAEAARQQELARLEAQQAGLARRIETLRRGGGGP